MKNCPSEAIVGTLKSPHHVDPGTLHRVRDVRGRVPLRRRDGRVNQGEDDCDQIEVNGRTVDAQDGETVLAAVRRAGIAIPTLCHYDGLPPSGACRMCVVDVEGQRSLVPSCAFPVASGMKVRTHSQRAVDARKTIVELLLANHPDDCLYCSRNGSCELQTLAQQLGVRRRRYFGSRSPAYRWTSPARRSSASPPSASCAASACGCARRSRPSARSTSSAAAAARTSARRSTRA